VVYYAKCCASFAYRHCHGSDSGEVFRSFGHTQRTLHCFKSIRRPNDGGSLATDNLSPADIFLCNCKYGFDRHLKTFEILFIPPGWLILQRLCIAPRPLRIIIHLNVSFSELYTSVNQWRRSVTSTGGGAKFLAQSHRSNVV